MSIYLAIDLGTTGCRSILFDEKLCQLAASYEEYGLITPREKWTEQDAELWWELTLRTAERAISKAGISAKEIKSISISSQGITVVPVDRDLKPLCNAINWLDVRAEQEAEQIEKDFGRDKIFKLTGKNIEPDYTLPKLLWWKKYEPEIFNGAWKFLMPMDFLIAKFTGNCVTDHSMASGTLMYDLKNLCWSREILDFYGIEEEKLPSLAFGGESAGKVLPKVAKKLGLSEDCVVGVGAQDQKCAAHGVGLRDGVMTISLGTAAAITKLWNEAKTEINTGVGWCGYVKPGAFVTEGTIGTAGTCLRFTRDLMFKDEDYVTIDKEAEEARERGSSVIFIPYMTGSSDEENIVSEEGCFYGVNLASQRGDFALAVMEGVAFQMRVILEKMEAYGNIHTLILLGGGAKSQLWSQIIADATGMQLKVPTVIEAAGAGAARLAAQAVGDDIPPLETAGVYNPSERTAAYEKKYGKYKQIVAKLWGKE